MRAAPLAAAWSSPELFTWRVRIIGYILGLYWGYIGYILGLYWGYIGVILGYHTMVPII